MRAFVNTEVSRDELIASLKAHRAADRIVQGVYWQGNGEGRGCAVGCSIHAFRPGEERSHELYETLFGVPQSVAQIQDVIFEGLPEDEAPDWPLRVVRAIRPGADLSRIIPALLYRIGERGRDVLADLDIDDSLRDTVRDAMNQVLGVLATWRDTGVVDESAARSARSAARSAESASRSAAWSAESAAEYRWIADALIEEIERTPTPTKERAMADYETRAGHRIVVYQARGWKWAYCNRCGRDGPHLADRFDERVGECAGAAPEGER